MLAKVKEVIKDALISAAIIVIATLICFLLKSADGTAAYSSMIFILAVFLIARFSHGYIYGIVSSFAGVLIVNFVFTYPFFEFNFTISGYPAFILCMLIVSIITSTMMSQHKKQEKMRMEAELEKTRSNLLRAVSHDLRTPLTAINGACSIMIENDDIISRKKRIKLLNEIKDDSMWLIRMVENLLSITRIDADKAKIVKKQEAVEEVIADSAAKFKKQYPQQNLIVNIPEELVLIPMDVILIEQVLMNLLENAVIHSGNATEIRLSAELKDDCVEFSVKDNGKGISSSVIPHIFDGYFNRSYEKSGDTKRCMGIGLSVCNTIVRAHGGTMSALNLKSGGACFRFTLPAEDE